MYRSSGERYVELLDTFFDQGYIEEVLGVIKIGKEASVYCCRGGPSAGAGLIAAKVYRGRQYRFKNDAVYQQSRVREMGIPPRMARALARKSAFGKQVQEATWRHHEFDVLQRLYDAGASVPRPIAAEGDVLLLEYFGDEDGAAPQLLRAKLEPDEARRAHAQILDDVETMLASNVVHGDLSPHNILYWQGRPVTIDLPQAVDPRFNPSARDLLHRDVANVCRHFEGCGIGSDAWAIAEDLWRRFTFGKL